MQLLLIWTTQADKLPRHRTYLPTEYGPGSSHLHARSPNLRSHLATRRIHFWSALAATFSFNRLLPSFTTSGRLISIFLLAGLKDARYVPSAGAQSVNRLVCPQPCFQVFKPPLPPLFLFFTSSSALCFSPNHDSLPHFSYLSLFGPFTHTKVFFFPPIPAFANISPTPGQMDFEPSHASGVAANEAPMVRVFPLIHPTLFIPLDVIPSHTCLPAPSFTTH